MATKKKKKSAAAPKKKATTKKKPVAKTKPIAKKKSAPKAVVKKPAKKVAAKTKKKKATAVKAPATTATATTKKTKVAAKGALPSKDDEARFWALIEDAWATQGEEVNAARHEIATREPGDDDVEAEPVIDALEEVVDSLRAVFAFEDFPKEELVAMDRVLERKLYEIDRAEIQEITDGSDDGFLYARGFIVAMGKEFFDAVNANPKMALDDYECEEMCYLPATVHNDRYGDYPETGSDISRESCSNGAGWPPE